MRPIRPFALPRATRTVFAHVSTRSPCPHGTKPRQPLPVLAVIFLFPFLVACLRTASLRGQLSNTTRPVSLQWERETRLVSIQGPRPLLAGSVASPRDINGANEVSGRHLGRSGNGAPSSPKQTKRHSKASKGEDEQSSRKVDLIRDEPIFVPEDINNPTKVPQPPDGFPPRDLPHSHPRYAQLDRIRRSCKMTPRWPKHPGMHAIELRSYGPAYSSIVVSEKLKVIYVPVFKVGTTSMMWHIAYLENNRHILSQNTSKPGVRDFVLHEMSSPGWQNHTIFRRSLPQIRRFFEDPEYLKFGFVRNPFERIISAYLDKIVGHPIQSKEYQLQMYGLYGYDHELRQQRNISKPSFREFLLAVQRVLEQPRTNSSDFWSRNAFEDNRSRRDLHWRPQVELLHPDLVHLDYVGRFERLEQERQVILDWMYKHTDRRMPKTYEEKLHSTNPGDKAQLYKDLRNDKCSQNLILSIYKADFDRFQFSKKVPKV